MESMTTRNGVDLSAVRTYPSPALILALLAIPGSTATWDTLPGGGFMFGFPPAIAAVVLGLQHLRSSAAENRGKARAAVAIGALLLAMMVVWTVAEAL
jgi:hypothetical protein